MHRIALLALTLPIAASAARGESAALTLWRGEAALGCGTALSRRLGVTTGHVLAPDSAAATTFTFSGGGNARGRIRKAREFGPLLIRSPFTGGRLTTEGPVLFLMEEKSPPGFTESTFPRLPSPEAKPAGPLLAVGAGFRRAPLAFGGLLDLSTPRGNFLLYSNRGPAGERLLGGDSGGGLREGNTLQGIHLFVLGSDNVRLPAPYEKLAGIHFWLGEPRLRDWLLATAREWGAPLD